MPSMIIRRFAYDLLASNLWIEFTTGHRHVYSDVPPEVANAFGAAFARGVYFDTRIRGHYPHREVVHEQRQVHS